MFPIILLYILLIPAVATYLHTKRIGRKRLSVLIKVFCTGIIFLTALIGLSDKPTNISVYSIMIVSGILLGLIGDLTIEYRFEVGMVFFGLGHICYIAAILNISENILLGVPLLSILCLSVYVLYKKSRLSFGKLIAPCVAYCIIILIMLSFAATIPFSIPIGGTVLFLGAVLFTVSDVMLAFINFGNSRNSNKMIDTVCLYSYFIGQSLFAVSVYFIS